MDKITTGLPNPNDVVVFDRRGLMMVWSNDGDGHMRRDIVHRNDVPVGSPLRPFLVVPSASHLVPNPELILGIVGDIETGILNIVAKANDGGCSGIIALCLGDMIEFAEYFRALKDGKPYAPQASTNGCRKGLIVVPNNGMNPRDFEAAFKNMIGSVRPGDRRIIAANDHAHLICN